MDHQLLYYLGAVLAFVFGMGCGALTTMPYYRLPNGMPAGGKWTGKRAHCPACGVKLRTRDMVPIFNWLGHRGKCFNCGAKISPVYFWLEFSGAVLSVLFYLKYGFSEWFVIYYGLSLLLILQSAIDYSYRKVVTPLLVLNVLLAFLAMPPSAFFDQMHVFIVVILALLAFVGVWEKMKNATFQQYDYLKLIAISGLWMSYLEAFLFLAGVGMVAWMAYITSDYKDSEHAHPPYAMLAAAVWLGFLLFVV